MAYPGDLQVLQDPSILGGYWLLADLDSTTYGDDTISHIPNYRIQRAIVLCRPQIAPAAFVAKFMGPASDKMDVTGSGRVSESIFTADPNRYEDEPVIAYELSAKVSKMNLAQELQSTGDDLFLCREQTGVVPAQGAVSKTKYQVTSGDTHRLESAELFLRRGTGTMPGTASMQVAPVTSNILDTQAGTLGVAKSIPGLNSASPIKAPVGGLSTGRFFGFRLEGSNVNSVFRFLGALLRGRRTT